MMARSNAQLGLRDGSPGLTIFPRIFSSMREYQGDRVPGGKSWPQTASALSRWSTKKHVMSRNFTRVGSLEWPARPPPASSRRSITPREIHCRFDAWRGTSRICSGAIVCGSVQCRRASLCVVSIERTNAAPKSVRPCMSVAARHQVLAGLMSR
jgi:hypothetical protein